MARVTVSIIELDHPVNKAYFILPHTFVGDLIQESESNIVVRFGKGNYCFKQHEVMYMVHDELAEICP